LASGAPGDAGGRGTIRRVVEGRRAAILLAVVGALVAAAYFVPALHLGPFDDDDDAPTGANAPTHGCDHARDEPRDGVRKAELATLCLLNAERRARGLGRLRENRALRRAALRHSEDMVERDFFEHGNPDGVGPHERIVRAGYTLRRTGFSTGENLATGDPGTPAAMVDGWMHSPGHRRNILRRSFDEIGIGIVPRHQEGGLGATYTTTFGGRR
jgi:uncharacterized protein YkwD